ncbi:MAG: hypothetical protein IPL97_00710 [Niastella sp.]|nr:hypothetical protein [Niastella sp.]
MKFITSLILTALLSYSACLFLPWWSIAIAAFLVALLISQKIGWAFLSGFLAVFILWFALSQYISSKNEDILAHKVSQIILQTDNPFMLILVTSFIGAVVAGLAAAAGASLKLKKLRN